MTWNIMSDHRHFRNLTIANNKVDWCRSVSVFWWVILWMCPYVVTVRGGRWRGWAIDVVVEPPLGHDALQSTSSYPPYSQHWHWLLLVLWVIYFMCGSHYNMPGCQLDLKTNVYPNIFYFWHKPSMISWNDSDLEWMRISIPPSIWEYNIRQPRVVFCVAKKHLKTKGKQMCQIKIMKSLNITFKFIQICSSLLCAASIK